jgi:predicted nucleic acid-binding protein
VIVVDASALLEVLLRTPAAVAVEERLFGEGLPLHAPHPIDVEVAQVLRRYAATRQISPARCRDAIDAL